MSSTILNPEDNMPAWPKETARARLKSCADCLIIRGLITDSEWHRIQKRIDKWIKSYSKAFND